MKRLTGSPLTLLLKDKKRASAILYFMTFDLADAIWGVSPNMVILLGALGLALEIVALVAIVKPVLLWNRSRPICIAVIVLAGVLAAGILGGLWHDEFIMFNRISVGPQSLTLDYPFGFYGPIDIPLDTVLAMKIGPAPNWNNDRRIHTFEIELQNGEFIISRRTVTDEELSNIESALEGTRYSRCSATVLQQTTTPLFEADARVWSEYFDRLACLSGSSG